MFRDLISRKFYPWRILIFFFNFFPPFNIEIWICRRWWSRFKFNKTDLPCQLTRQKNLWNTRCRARHSTAQISWTRNIDSWLIALPNTSCTVRNKKNCQKSTIFFLVRQLIILSIIWRLLEIYAYHVDERRGFSTSKQISRWLYIGTARGRIRNTQTRVGDCSQRHSVLRRECGYHQSRCLYIIKEIIIISCKINNFYRFVAEYPGSRFSEAATAGDYGKYRWSSCENEKRHDDQTRCYTSQCHRIGLLQQHNDAALCNGQCHR